MLGFNEQRKRNTPKRLRKKIKKEGGALETVSLKARKCFQKVKLKEGKYYRDLRSKRSPLKRKL